MLEYMNYYEINFSELKMPQIIWHQIAKFKEKDWLKLWLSTTNPRHDNDERMVIIHYFFSVFWENVLKLQLVQTKSFFFQKWLLRQLVHKKKTVWWLFLNYDMTCTLWSPNECWFYKKTICTILFVATLKIFLLFIKL